MTNLVHRPPRQLIAGDFDSLRRAMHRILDGTLDSRAARAPRRFALDVSDASVLPLDISEHDGDIVVRAAVPGFTRDDIDVQLHDGVLSITARKRSSLARNSASAR